MAHFRVSMRNGYILGRNVAPVRRQQYPRSIYGSHELPKTHRPESRGTLALMLIISTCCGTDALPLIVAPVGRLPAGIGSLRDASGSLRDGSNLLWDASGSLWDSSSSLRDGCTSFAASGFPQPTERPLVRYRQYRRSWRFLPQERRTSDEDHRNPHRSRPMRSYAHSPPYEPHHPRCPPCSLCRSK